MAKAKFEEVYGEVIERFFSENANEKKSLLNSLQLNAGEDESDEDESDEGDEKVKPIELSSLLELFHFVTSYDIRIIAVGVLFTIIHGAGFPILALTFGNFCESFIAQIFHSNQRTTAGEHPSGYLNYNVSRISARDDYEAAGKVFGKIGDTIGIKANTEQVSRDAFLTYAMYFAIYIALGSVVIFIASFIQTACWECAAVNQIFRIRQKFLAQVLRQDISWFDNRTAGYLMVKLVDDVERMREGIGHKFGLVLQYTVCFVFGVFFAFCTNFKLTLLFGAAAPLVIHRILSLLRELTVKSMKCQEQSGRIGAISNEVLSDPRTVAAFGTETDEYELYEAEQISGLITARRKHKAIGLSIGIIYLLIYGSYALGFWYAANQFVEGLISATEIYTVFFCVSVGLLALISILPFIPDIAHAYGCSKIITDIIATMPNVDPYSREGQKLRKIVGKIKFSNVTFSYPSRLNTTVLRDVNFTIKGGETVAIVGPSGAGKSTLLQLLPRFYDPQSGYITFDDVDLKNLNVGWLRSQIGFVSESLTFEDSIFENIRSGRNFITLDQVVKVSKITCAHSFIRNLPQGYNTIIGVSDTELSTGQKQLLALTRAVILRPKILVLDDCMTEVDTPTVMRVMKNVIKYRTGCTNITVSHRLARLQRFNKIIFLEDGEVAEDGTPAELMAAQGQYYRMAKVDGDTSQTMADKWETIEKDQEAHDDDVQPEVSELKPGTIDPPKTHRVTYPDVKSRTVVVETRSDLDCMPPDLEYPSLGSMWEYFRNEKLLIRNTCLGLLGCVISGIIIPVFAIVFGQLFLAFYESGDDILTSVMFWIGVLIAAALAGTVGYWLRVVFVSIVGEMLTQKLRTVCYLSMLRQSMAWFDEKAHSDNRLFIRLASDAPLFTVAIGSGLATAMSAVISQIVAVVYSAVLCWQLFLVVFLAVPMFYGTQVYEAYLYTKSQLSIMELHQPSILLATKSVQNIRAVQAYSLQTDVLKRYIDMVYPVLARCHRQAVSFSLAIAFIEALIILVLASVFGVGAYLIGKNEIGPITLFKVFTVLTFSSITGGHLTSYIPDFVKARLAFGQVFCFFDIESSIDAFEELGVRPKELGRICFDDVHFSYPQRPEKMVLQGVSLTIEPGTCLAIMGDLGKTTMLSLLERFYDVTSGHVTFGGSDVKDLKLDYLRANIGYVAQDSNLFNRTIRENILYGVTDIEQRELDRRFEVAADAIGLTGWHLPKGYDTVVGVNGSQLTGGQRQKITIARALIRQPQILLLDTPVSALGPEDEHSFLEILKKVIVGRTCIIVSNSPNTILSADVVAVLKGGKIVEFGKHDELNQLKGVYYNSMKTDFTE